MISTGFMRVLRTVFSICVTRQRGLPQFVNQNGTVHDYLYDRLGRQSEDRVTTLGTGIDGSVRRIAFTYNLLDQPEKITSTSTAIGRTIVNDIQYNYNDFQQLTVEYQSHGGAASTSSTPKVTYGYADGSTNTARFTSQTYPNGRMVFYIYASGDDDALSRVTSLNDGASPRIRKCRRVPYCGERHTDGTHPGLCR